MVFLILSFSQVISSISGADAQLVKPTIIATMKFDTEATDGLYLQNRWTTIRTITNNTGTQTDNVDISILLFQVIPRTSQDSPNELKIDEIPDHATLAPNQATYNFISHSYLAGSYHLVVIVSGEKGGGGTYDFFFDINTLQELYAKQQAEYARQQAEYSKQQVDISQNSVAASWNGVLVAYVSAFVVAAIGILTMIANLSQATSTRESTELARLQITEGLKPQFQLIDATATIRISKQSVQFRGKIKNVGQVAARNIIGHSAVVNGDQLRDILAEKDRIKDLPPVVIGTIQPNDSFEYTFDKNGPSEAYAVIWLQYGFLRSQNEEAIVWLNLIPGSSTVNHRWWTDEDIHPNQDVRKPLHQLLLEAAKKIPNLVFSRSDSKIVEIPVENESVEKTTGIPAEEAKEKSST